MTTVALVLGVVLAAGAVLLVALPFLRDPTPVDDRLRQPIGVTRLEWLEPNAVSFQCDRRERDHGRFLCVAFKIFSE